MEQLLSEVLKEPPRFFLISSSVEREEGVPGPLHDLNANFFWFRVWFGLFFLPSTLHLSGYYIEQNRMFLYGFGDLLNQNSLFTQ